MQFKLRTLFGSVTVLALLFGLLSAPGVGTMGVLVLALTLGSLLGAVLGLRAARKAPPWGLLTGPLCGAVGACVCAEITILLVIALFPDPRPESVLNPASDSVSTPIHLSLFMGAVWGTLLGLATASLWVSQQRVGIGSRSDKPRR